MQLIKVTLIHKHNLKLFEEVRFRKQENITVGQIIAPGEASQSNRNTYTHGLFACTLSTLSSVLI